MEVTLTQLLVWIVIAAIIGILGELISGRRAPAGMLGAIVLGFLAILLIVGVFHFHIVGEPTLEGVPLISTILAAVLLVVLWSSFAYRASVYRR
ncbi:MAG TPA: transglycosylase [Ktedonobacteraceae bacterium]|nr:transglycosylase [Ktedonobacteraceae bacterium]